MARIVQILLILCASWLQPSPAMAAGSLTGSVDKTEGSIYDIFIYSLIISGSDYDDLPRFPRVDGLEVSQSGTSRNFSMINGTIKREFTVKYQLKPLREGRFTIPSLAMKVDNKVMKTLPITIQVHKSPPKVQDDEAKIFVKRELDKTRFYVGEVVQQTARIYNRVGMSGAKVFFEEPSSFKEIPIDKEKRTRQMVGRHRYDIVRLDSLFIPTQPGRFTLQPYGLQANIQVSNPNQRQRQRQSPFGGFFGRGNFQTVTVVSEELEVEVLPLPSQGRPQDFSGLVGEFTMEGGLSIKELNVGETSTLTISIGGKGRVLGTKPPLLQLPDSIKVYEDQPIMEELPTRSQGLQSEMIFKFALVPRAGGAVPLGSAKLWYFDTKSESYRQLVVELGALQVTGGPESSEAGAGDASNIGREKTAVKVLGKDVLGLKREQSYAAPTGVTQASLALAAVLPGLSLAVLILLAMRRWMAADPEGRARRRRSSGAAKNFRSALVAAEDAQSMHSALKIYLADRFDLSAGALTRRDVESVLGSAGVGEATIRQVTGIVDQLESVHYGGQQVNQQQLAGWRSSLEPLIGEVERL